MVDRRAVHASLARPSHPTKYNAVAVAWSRLLGRTDSPHANISKW